MIRKAFRVKGRFLLNSEFQDYLNESNFDYSAAKIRTGYSERQLRRYLKEGIPAKWDIWKRILLPLGMIPEEALEPLDDINTISFPKIEENVFKFYPKWEKELDEREIIHLRNLSAGEASFEALKVENTYDISLNNPTSLIMLKLEDLRKLSVDNSALQRKDKKFDDSFHQQLKKVENQQPLRKKIEELNDLGVFIYIGTFRHVSQENEYHEFAKEGPKNVEQFFGTSHTLTVITDQIYTHAEVPLGVREKHYSQDGVETRIDFVPMPIEK